MPVQSNTVTGDARITFTGNPLTVLGIYIGCNTCGSSVDRRNGVAPKRIMHGGWVALGATGVTNRPFDHILWSKYLEYEAEWIKLSPSVVADFLSYHVPPDSYLTITVNY